MKTNIKYINIEKRVHRSPMSYLKSILFATVFAVAVLNVQASKNNILKSDTSEIDTFQSNEEAEMELEAWMLDVDLFKQYIMGNKTVGNPCKHIAKTKEEQELPLEMWMLDRELFYKKFKNEKLEKAPIAKWDKLK